MHPGSAATPPSRPVTNATSEADAPQSVIAFVQKLEASDVFGSTEVSTWTPPTQNDPFYHYRLSVNYAQKI